MNLKGLAKVDTLGKAYMRLCLASALLVFCMSFLLAQTPGELWLNPVTNKYEKVKIEDVRSKKFVPKKTELWLNPVTKKYEKILVENGDAEVTYPDSLDNGLPRKTAQDWKEQITGKTGPNWRTYTNAKTKQTVSFNPRTSELWYNPVKQLWEPVVRDQKNQKEYIKNVARQLAELRRPKNATGWLCNLSDTVHASPYDCQNPDLGGAWIVSNK